MCTVSMIGDHYDDKWKKPDYQKFFNDFQTPPSRYEFEVLKKEVEEMKALLIRAKAYDEKNNEPNCEVEPKMETLRKMAALVGINLDDVINPPKV